MDADEQNFTLWHLFSGIYQATIISRKDAKALRISIASALSVEFAALEMWEGP
jgi:hypothetical protein